MLLNTQQINYFLLQVATLAAEIFELADAEM
jgi:hypothetical protein